MKTVLIFENTLLMNVYIKFYPIIYLCIDAFYFKYRKKYIEMSLHPYGANGNTTASFCLCIK